ncbi:MAG TPA: HNH endonuclease [Chitinophagaceae bacterium]|nr:HNH endonuclease [Chitinophagaceae bacterium]
MEDDGSIILTRHDYERVISESLSPKQIELLQLLYSCDNKSATAKQLAALLSPNNPAIIIANRQIGRLGKAVADFFNVIPGDTYQDDAGNLQEDFFGWFNMISDGYSKKTGWTLLPEIQDALKNLGLVNDGFPIEERLSTETQPFDEQLFLKEGKVIEVSVNKYERNQRARIECIEALGNKCYACDFDFEQTYGDIAKGFIHVHHIRPLSEIKEEYHVDPKKDLVPLCPNCHAVVHLTKPELTITELKDKLKKNSCLHAVLHKRG